jgi:release factor glutamine methyltransferase
MSDFPADLQGLYVSLKQILKDSGIDHHDLEARMILQQRAGINLTDLIANPQEILARDAILTIESDLKARLAGMPLSRLYGVREFWGMAFDLAPDTLEPRPDTETLVELALKRFSGRPPTRFLDLGTGSGCILAALLREWPDSQGFAVDLSFGALKVAAGNLQRHDLRARAHLLCGDWLSAISGGFDLVVSNPPYITTLDMADLAPEVRNHDPILALDGGPDGLQAYRSIFLNLFSVLNAGGKALFEIGYNQAEDVVRLAEESGFLVAGVHNDLAGRPRVVEIICGDK